MEKIVVEPTGNGGYALRGELNFATVPDAWRQTRDIFAHNNPLAIDLAGVTRSDSAALVLLLEWIRLAQRRGQKLSYQNLPPQLLAVAKVSGIASLFVD